MNFYVIIDIIQNYVFRNEGGVPIIGTLKN